MSRLAPFVALSLSGCASGPSVETLVERLQVLAIVADPPEAAPDEGVDLAVTIVDPEQLGADVAVWTCTDLGEGCLEAPELAAVVPTVDGTASASATVPASLVALVDDTQALPLTRVWALACAPGACALIDDIRDLSADPADLRDPRDAIADLSIDQASVAAKSLHVSTRAPADRPGNPTLTPTFDSLTRPAAGQTLTLTFDASGDSAVELWAYSTAGGFDEPMTPVDDNGSATLTWTAPEDETAEEVQLYVIAEDEANGTAIWTRTL